MGVGGGWEAEGGYTIHKETNSSAVCSVLHRNSHSQPGRPRRSPAAFDKTALLVPISGPIDRVVDRRGFTGSSKDRL